MTRMSTITCKCGCGRTKEVRTADVERGWGLFYNKSCKQKYQEDKRKVFKTLASTQMLLEMKHFISASCEGEKCRMCGKDATHKVGEEIAHDDPNGYRHNYTAYVCCGCFRSIFGPAVVCEE